MFGWLHMGMAKSSMNMGGEGFPIFYRGTLANDLPHPPAMNPQVVNKRGRDRKWLQGVNVAKDPVGLDLPCR